SIITAVSPPGLARWVVNVFGQLLGWRAHPPPRRPEARGGPGGWFGSGPPPLSPGPPPGGSPAPPPSLAARPRGRRRARPRRPRVPHRFPALIADPPRDQGRLWLTGGRLFDGTGSPVREGAAVLVEDGVIRRVGRASEPCPGGARLLDLERRTLMPGLIEAHTHILSETPPTLRGAEPFLPGTAAHFLQAGLREVLRMGVTTIRFTGAQGQRPQQA